MIKKSLFLFVVACTVINITHAMVSTVQLPSEKALKESLCDAGFDFFVSETNIHKILGNRYVVLSELSKIVCKEVDYYHWSLCETLNNQQQGVGFQITSFVWINKESILRCVLRDSKVFNSLLDYEEKLANRQSKL